MPTLPPTATRGRDAHDCSTIAAHCMRRCHIQGEDLLGARHHARSVARNEVNLNASLRDRPETEVRVRPLEIARPAYPAKPRRAQGRVPAAQPAGDPRCRPAARIEAAVSSSSCRRASSCRSRSLRPTPASRAAHDRLRTRSAPLSPSPVCHAQQVDPTHQLSGTVETVEAGHAHRAGAHPAARCHGPPYARLPARARPPARPHRLLALIAALPRLQQAIQMS